MSKECHGMYGPLVKAARSLVEEMVFYPYSEDGKPELGAYCVIHRGPLEDCPSNCPVHAVRNALRDIDRG